MPKLSSMKKRSQLICIDRKSFILFHIFYSYFRLQVGFCWAHLCTRTTSVQHKYCQNGSNRETLPPVWHYGTIWTTGQQRKITNQHPFHTIQYVTTLRMHFILFSFLIDFLRKCAQMSFRHKSPASLCARLRILCGRVHSLHRSNLWIRHDSKNY